MKAQIATEYLFIMLFATVLLVGYLSVAGVIGGRAVDASTAATADRIAFDIQSEIVLATQVRSGYNRTFWIPETVDGRSVTVRNGSQIVEVRVDGVSTAARTPPYQGPLTPGWNTISRTQDGVVIG